MAGGELEVPGSLHPLRPLDDPGPRAVDASLRALAAADLDDESRVRLEDAARTADLDAACWLWSWLGWHAFRGGAPDRAARCLECLLDRLPDRPLTVGPGYNKAPAPETERRQAPRG